MLKLIDSNSQRTMSKILTAYMYVYTHYYQHDTLVFVHFIPSFNARVKLESFVSLQCIQGDRFFKLNMVRTFKEVTQDVHTRPSGQLHVRKHIS